MGTYLCRTWETLPADYIRVLCWKELALQLKMSSQRWTVAWSISGQVGVDVSLHKCLAELLCEIAKDGGLNPLSVEVSSD